MASGKFCLIALCSLALLSHLIVPARSRSCCLKYSKRPLPCKRLLAYRVQNINQVCDINAVIFYQTNGKYVCADPLASETKRGMKCVNKKQRQVEKIMKQN